MKAQPVKSASRPKYPTQSETASWSDWLRAHVPGCWKKLLGAGGAAAFFAAGLTGCSDGADSSGGSSDGNAIVKLGPASRSAGRLVPTAAIVAPIFQHGEGRAATGCVVISPPVFLTEEEALQVIKEELGKHGVSLALQDVELGGIKLRSLYTQERLAEFRKVNPDAARKAGKYATTAFCIDAVDPARCIAVEFVSGADCVRLAKEDEFPSTVSSYDFQESAAKLRTAIIASRQKGYFGTFYDPATVIDRHSPQAQRDRPQTPEAWESWWKQQKQQATQTSKDLLRQQAADFAEWLKQRGAL